jgi:protein-S-isoprenylcysteine O-methyltransferase Ste14
MVALVRRLLHQKTGRISRVEGQDLKYSSSNRGLPAGNPIANIFVVLVGALVIGVSIVLGFVAFVVLGAVIAVLASVIGLRFWWFNRKLKRQGPNAQTGGSVKSGGFIEGEYRIVEDDNDNARDR